MNKSLFSRQTIVLAIALGVITTTAKAQSVAINGTGANPDASSILDLSSTSKGMLVPRLTLIQRNGILNPATGLLIYQTDNAAGFYYFNGLIWVPVSSTAGGLSNGTLAGNTTFWNGTQWVVNSANIYNNGANVGVGTSSPMHKLDVNGRLHLTDGVVQRGGAPITTTSDLGLYSRNSGSWMRLVTNAAPIKFYSDDNSGTNWNMSIESNGNVGIGTNLTAMSRLSILVPDDKNGNPMDNGIHVYNNGNAGDNDDAIIAARVADAGSGDPFFSVDINGIGGWAFGLDNSDNDKFKIGRSWNDPGSNTKFTIDPNGMVGLSTANPSAMLQVDHNSASTYGTSVLLYENQAGNSDGSKIGFDKYTPDKRWSIGMMAGNTETGFGINEDGGINGFGNNRMYFQAGGNVGVGTSAPTAKLDVNGSIKVGGGTAVNKIQTGQATLGTGTAGVQQFTITFPTAFTGVPRVVVSAESANTSTETFITTVKSITTTTFMVNVYRIDSPGAAWTQSLKLNWYAFQ